LKILYELKVKKKNWLNQNKNLIYLQEPKIYLTFKFYSINILKKNASVHGTLVNKTKYSTNILKLV